MNKQTILLLAFCIFTPYLFQEEEVESHAFQTDVTRLLDIIVNSLYSQKDVFIREAISNASDALDKLRYLAIKNPELMKDNPDLTIHIETDLENQTISITDTGVGMTR